MLEPTSRHGPYMSDMGCASIGVMTCQKEPDKQTPGERTHRARCKFTPQTECFPSVQIIPLVNVYTAIENGQRNSWFVDLPIKKIVIFHSYVRLPEGNPIGFRVQSSLKRTHHFLWPFKKQTSPLSMWNSTEVYQVSFSGSRSALGNPLNRAQPQELDAAAAQGGQLGCVARAVLDGGHFQDQGSWRWGSDGGSQDWVFTKHQAQVIPRANLKELLFWGHQNGGLAESWCSVSFLEGKWLDKWLGWHKELSPAAKMRWNRHCGVVVGKTHHTASTCHLH